MTNGNSLPRTADIVILGAGVMGASIAFHLAQSKPGSIIVLDKDHVDMGQAADPPRSSGCITVFPQKFS